MTDTEPETRPRANSLAALPSLNVSQRRLRANTQLSGTASPDSLTPRNRARALAHLRLVGDQTQNEFDSDESTDGTNSSTSSEKSSASTSTEFVVPPSNLNQADVNSVRDESRRVDAVEAARAKRDVRRTKSESYEPQPDEITRATHAIGSALKDPSGDRKSVV